LKLIAEQMSIHVTHKYVKSHGSWGFWRVSRVKSFEINKCDLGVLLECFSIRERDSGSQTDDLMFST